MSKKIEREMNKKVAAMDAAQLEALRAEMQDKVLNKKISLGRRAAHLGAGAVMSGAAGIAALDRISTKIPSTSSLDAMKTKQGMIVTAVGLLATVGISAIANKREHHRNEERLSFVEREMQRREQSSMQQGHAIT